MSEDRIGLLSRSSENDLKVTFEKDGESISIYLTPGKYRAESIASEIACALCCSQKSGFAACMARCLFDGRCCDGGVKNCQDA